MKTQILGERCQLSSGEYCILDLCASLKLYELLYVKSAAQLMHLISRQHRTSLQQGKKKNNVLFSKALRIQVS